MLKNLIILPDGTELFSGKGTKNAVMSTTLTECVNSGEELTLGSTCSYMLEATIWTPGGGLSLTAGDELTLYKVDDAGTRHKVGIFAIEKPTKPSTNTMKIIGYDRVTKLDKDLTSWLKALNGWPYTLLTFAKKVCTACGVTLATETIPNADFLVNQFSKPEVTGRQLMRYIGEVCSRFCRANADGEIEFAWYTPSGISLAPSGENYYFARGLSYEDYRVAPIEAVQLRLADSENGYLWPTVAEGANSYIITENPLFMAAVTEETLVYLEVIKAELAGLTYTPCKVSFPARFDIRAGTTVEVTDNNGVTFTAYVMTKTQKGQRDTIECAGSARRDSPTAQNNKSGSALEEERKIQLTQEEVFEILTNGGEIEGLFMKDGKLYINALYIASGRLSSTDGQAFFDLDQGIFGIKSPLVGNTVIDKSLNISPIGLTLMMNTGADSALETYLRLDCDEDGACLYSPDGKRVMLGNALTPVMITGASINIQGAPLYIGGKKMQWVTNPGDGFSYLVGVDV